MLLTAPHEVAVVTVANSAEAAMPKRVSLPSMLPPDWPRAGGLVDAEAARCSGLPCCSLYTAMSQQRHEQDAPWPRAPPSPGAVSPTMRPKV